MTKVVSEILFLKNSTEFTTMENSTKYSSSPDEMKSLRLTIKGLELELEELRTANEQLNRRFINCDKTMDESKIAGNRFRAFFDQSNHVSMVLDPNTPNGIPVIIEANKLPSKHTDNGCNALL